MYLLRFVLCCMVVWCCGWVGRILSSSIRERPRQLLDLQAAVSRLETEINHSMTFLPEALQELARVTPSPVNRLFEDAAHLLLEVELPMERAWHEAVVGARQYLVLNRDDERILLNLGSSLGISPRGDQARHLTIAQELLKGQEVAARHVEQHSARLYQALGWAAGTALILMLI